MTEPQHHFPDDVLRGFAIGTSPEATRLAVACHLAFCATCRAGAQQHEEVLGGLGRMLAVAPPAGRDRLFAGLPAQPARPAPPPPSPLPADLPELPAVLAEHLGRLAAPRWRRLVPGLRAIELGFTDVWRARLVAFRPGIPIPRHDHGGPEHTVIFQGGLDDASGHLERGDAATMVPGEAHDQRAAKGLPCVALIVNELEPRPLTAFGKLLKVVTRS